MNDLVHMVDLRQKVYLSLLLKNETDSQRRTFSIYPPKNLTEERNWLLAVESVESINSVLDISF